MQHLIARAADGGGSFIARGEMIMVLQVLIPMTIFVVLSIYIGIYISMFLFIGFFMIWHGHYPIYKTLAGGARRAGRAVRRLRDLVSGAAAEGAVRGLARLLRPGVSRTIK